MSDIITIGDTNPGRITTSTVPTIRWVIRDGVTVLQQMQQVMTYGNSYTEWVDVPTVTEGEG